MEIPRDYLAVVRHNARKIISPVLLDVLRGDGIGEDFMQEQILVALEAEQGEMDLHETSNFAQRKVYRALINYGYFREKGSSSYSRREMDEEENEEQS